MFSIIGERGTAKDRWLASWGVPLALSTVLLTWLPAHARAAAPLQLAPALTMSTQLPDLAEADKSRITQLGNGTLVIVYADAVENEPSRQIYDLQSDTQRPARDIFVRTCNDFAADCGNPDNWTEPVNISRTAALSSIATDWTGDSDASSERTPFFGDASKPSIFSAGNRVVVTWVGSYCPAEAGQPTPQRTVTYADRGNREVPFNCVYAAHANGRTATAADWTVTRLTDGSRDANQDVSRGLQNGGWAIIWQEDPRGLQPGEAEGPGDGASGSRVSPGTDIWYTYSGPEAAFGAWHTPVRITDNLAAVSSNQHTGVIKDASGGLVDPALIETGTVGASRPNLGLVSNTAIVAYEENKGAGQPELVSGKFVRYHQFPYQNPPGDPAGRTGCVISDPQENARRVRLVTQGTPGPESALRWSIFWRQGIDGQGAPADILLRFGKTDFTPANLFPPVDPGCATSLFAEAVLLQNEAGYNVSSNTPAASAINLYDATAANSSENGRAHRVLLRGDDLSVGYTYTGNDRLANELPPQANYNYWLRRFDAATGSWATPLNLSRISDPAVNAQEPRLMGTPGNGPGCPADPSQCQNPDIFFAAWAAERKDPATGAVVDSDLYLSYTGDGGGLFAPAVRIADGEDILAQAEIQLRAVPDGSRVFAVWNQKSRSGGSDALFSIGRLPGTPGYVSEQIGVFRGGSWYLDENGNGGWEGGEDATLESFGAASDLAVSGDVNGDGFSEIGVYRPESGQWFFDLDRSGTWGGCTSDGGSDLCMAQFGAPTDLPVAGDVNGDGVSEIGVYRPESGRWFFDLDRSGTWGGCTSNGGRDLCLAQFGAPTDLPVAGDVNGDGVSEIGVYRPESGRWFFDLDRSGTWGGCTSDGGRDLCLTQFGAPNDLPVTGDWNNDGVSEVGVFRDGQWYLDANGNGEWDPDLDAVYAAFGMQGDRPISGWWPARALQAQAP